MVNSINMKVLEVWRFGEFLASFIDMYRTNTRARARVPSISGSFAFRNWMCMCVNTHFLALLPFNWARLCIHMFMECNVNFTHANLCDVFFLLQVRYCAVTDTLHDSSCNISFKPGTATSKLIFTYIPCILILSNFVIHQLMQKLIVLKAIIKCTLKLTLKQLRHISVQSHRRQGAYYSCLLKFSLPPSSATYTHQQGPTNICSHIKTHRCNLINYFNNCNFSKHA